MARLFLTLLTLAPAFSVAATHAWTDEQTERADQAVKPSAAKTGPRIEIQKAVQAMLARFDKSDPGWKVRMEALVDLAKAGPKAAPFLVHALKTGSPPTREFAAQALVLFPDPGNRPALEQALAHQNHGQAPASRRGAGALHGNSRERQLDRQQLFSMTTARGLRSFSRQTAAGFGSRSPQLLSQTEELLLCQLQS